MKTETIYGVRGHWRRVGGRLQWTLTHQDADGVTRVHGAEPLGEMLPALLGEVDNPYTDAPRRIADLAPTDDEPAQRMLAVVECPVCERPVTAHWDVGEGDPTVDERDCSCTWTADDEAQFIEAVYAIADSGE